MKRFILRFVYERNRKFFQDIFVEDLLLSIPDKISRPAIDILAARREAVKKWLFFEANSIYRRPITDFANSERRNGMLMLIQALLYAIGSREKTVSEEHPTVGETVAPPVDWQKNIEEFKKGSAKIST